ncbi:hypothetical protein CXG81DRAFT_25171 [Caulochytrium protostelioides]|uniref:Mitochondrial pyruvate carrier n=1 Tax=Caulochytrium protostelioides TaxID=1555241 RepID=A0A4P9XA12_9FUNG|nr:hypothetical protein CXG81DRAFT_25171 [Caulochytrium protostelioides]|eukprot:RKP02152.1 hypothetical protein CXG81DRAFT_25171 [Caulochytrium protostelioides]
MASGASATGSWFSRFLNSPAGPKTVHFWAPAMKWGLVIAGLGDINRPVENISMSQTVSLFATGVIWSRYSTVIIPKNYGLLSVNAFLACTALYQLTRIYRHNAETKAVAAAPATALADAAMAAVKKA